MHACLSALSACPSTSLPFCQYHPRSFPAPLPFPSLYFSLSLTLALALALPPLPPASPVLPVFPPHHVGRVQGA
jgi:hypothetical protein